MTTTPLSPAERITALDTLRGVAVLGILFMNIQLFAMPEAAYLNPTAYGDLTGANWVVWLVGRIFFDQKFMTLFSLLFGAGILLFAARADARGASASRLHYRRMGWLLVFGLLHAYGLWMGDILVTYALCGMLVFPFRNMAPLRLLGLGLTAIAVGSALWIVFGWSMQIWPADLVAQLEHEDWRPPAESIAEEIAIYQSGWWAQMQRRAPGAFAMQTFIFLIWGLWRAGGLMLVGMALYQLGVVTAQRSSRFYRRIVVIGLLAGLPLILYGVHQDVAADWDIRYSFFLGSQWNYWGSLFLSAAWLGLVLLGVTPAASDAEVSSRITGGRGRMLHRLAARFSAVGRMAFSNYVLQTLICTTIFYGHGLGWFGQVSRVGQTLVVLGVWWFLLVLSPFWLRRFYFGPLEWLWRSLTYGRRPPFRRLAAPDARASAPVA